jgi:hypothetical protein
MTVETSTISLTFDRRIENFTQIINLQTGENYVKQCPRDRLVDLFGVVKGEVIKLIPECPEVEEDENRILIHYSSFSGYPITLNVVCQCENDKVNISGTIRNESTIDVVEILMPHIGGIYLGNNTDDFIIYPHHAGERTKNPVLGYGVNKKDFWRASSVAFEDIYRREINYCGLASMTWMYYYNAQNGLYIGSHDERFPVTGIIAETNGREEEPWMAFGFRKHHRIRPGESYSTNNYVICISNNDWHYGSKIYRQYISPYLNFDHNPDYLRDEYALNQCYNFKRNGGIENYFKDIPQMYEKGATWGARHMFIASWNRTGFDSYYPEYYPDMELGTAMEFRRGLEYVRKHGGISTLYINARIFDIKSNFHKTLGEKMAIRNVKGDTYHETYGPEHFTVNCPSDKLWQDFLLDTAEFCVKAYGSDGIYLDQLASAEPFACYSEEHSHDDIGEFNTGYLYVLKELLERIRAFNPDSYIMTENCGDIYGSYTWGNLTWNGAEYDEFYNVFKYTFPEFTQVNMVNPRAWEEADKRPEWFKLDLYRAISLGNILWLGITSRLRPEDGWYHVYAKKAVNFRAKLQPLIKNAKFMDNAWIGNIPEKCFATYWELSDEKKLVIVGNNSDKEEEICVNNFSNLLELEQMDKDVEKPNIHKDGSVLRLKVPKEQLFYVLYE